MAYAFNLDAQTGSDWKWQHPSPQGNTIRYIKMWDANNWYAVGNVGTFMKTTNAGLNWTFNHNAMGYYIASGQRNSVYDAHFFNINTGVVVGSASTGNGPIVRTTNGGVTFDTIPNMVFTGVLYQVYFRDNNNGYAVGTTTPKLWRTFNGGVSWTGVATAPTTTLYDVYASDSLNIIVSTTAGNVAKSTNAGATWTTISTGASATLYKMEFITANLGAVTGTASAFRYTTNGGLNWTTPANTGLVAAATFYDMEVKPSAAAIYLTGNSFYLYKSTNLGTSWDTVGFLAPVSSQPWTSTYYATDMSAFGDTIITGGAFGLINRRVDASHTNVYTNLLKPGTVYDIWAQSTGTGTVIAVGASTSVGSAYDQIMRSVNGGNTWALVPYSTTSRTGFNDIEMVNDNTGWAVGTLSAVYKTTNAGANWDSVIISNMPAGLNLSKANFLNATTGWIFSKSYAAGDSSTIFKTTDGGVNWTNINLVNASGSAKQIYGASMIDANNGYLINWTPVPYKTTDGGTTWTPQTLIDGYGGLLYSIQMINATTGYVAGGSGHVYKTTNGGVLWDTLTIPTRSFTNYALQFYNANVGMVVGSSGTCFYTSNGGVNWISKNTNGNTMYGCFLLPSTKSFAVGAGGNILRNNVVVTGIAVNGIQLPVQFSLEQNYPNPFNPSTTISYAMPKAGLVNLKVYDIAGREVMTLIDNQQMSAGMNKITFNGSNLSSGVYFYSIKVDNNFLGTKKMILIK